MSGRRTVGERKTKYACIVEAGIYDNLNGRNSSQVS